MICILIIGNLHGNTKAMPTQSSQSELQNMYPTMILKIGDENDPRYLSILISYALLRRDIFQFLLDYFFICYPYLKVDAALKGGKGG